MGKADLHAHTRHDAWGDGNQTVEELFRHVEEETDLDVFAITDHDSTDAARAALDLHRRAGTRRSGARSGAGGYRFDFLPGVEVTNQSGHLLCYFPSGEIVDIPSLRPFWWTVRYAHEHGAICIVAHPVYPPWLAATLRRGLVAGERIDGIEAVNAGIPAKAQGRLHAIAAHFDLPQVGNSDAHHQVAVGSAYTLFPGKTADEFLQALGAGRTEPVLARRPAIDAASRRFTTRRSMTRPGWVRNLWREVRVSR